MKNLKYLLISVIVGLAVIGCDVKEDRAELDSINGMLYDHSAQFIRLGDSFYEFAKIQEKRIAELEKSADYSKVRRRLSSIETKQALYGEKWIGQGARLDDLETPADSVLYDPNAPIWSFMEVADPNWIRDYGDTEQTRHIYNTSKTRLIAAMMARRLLSLEAIHVEELKALLDPNDPNEVAK